MGLTQWTQVIDCTDKYTLFMIYLTCVSTKYFEVKSIILVCLIFTDELAHKRKWFLPYKNQYIDMQDTNQLTGFFNPSHPNPGKREKINLNFYFHTSSKCLKKIL